MPPAKIFARAIMAVSPSSRVADKTHGGPGSGYRYRAAPLLNRGVARGSAMLTAEIEAGEMREECVDVGRFLDDLGGRLARSVARAGLDADVLRLEIFAGGDEIVDHVLLARKAAGIVPRLAIFAAAAEVRDGIDSALLEPRQPRRGERRSQ